MREYKTTEARRAAQKRYRDKNPDYYKQYATSYNPDYYNANKEKMNAYGRDHHKKKMSTFEGRTKQLFLAARSRARKNCLEFDLEYNELVWPKQCPLLEVDLDYTHENCLSNNSPSLDRRDNTKGYTKENTWVVSRRANLIKRDATPKELMLIAKNLL